MAGKDKAADDFKIINAELKRIQREEAEGAKKAAEQRTAPPSTSSLPAQPHGNAADDFATIRAAAEKLKRERTERLNRPDDPSVAWKPPASLGLGASVEISGHEKTLTPLANIVAEYRKESFDSNRNYNFSQQRQDEAIKKIMGLSQFYYRSDAVQMLGRAVASAQRPGTTWKPPRGAPKSP